MNLTMRALIAVVATAAIVGLAGAYLGAAALQDGSPNEPGAGPPPGDNTPSPAATTPAATPSPAATTPAGTPVIPISWSEWHHFELNHPNDT